MGNYYKPNGEPFHNIKFSIIISNTVIHTDTTNNLFCQVNNSSTNTIGLWGGTAMVGNVILKNNSGKSYQLKTAYQNDQPTHAPAPIYTHDVKAGETYEWCEPLVINKKIEPGDYQIQAYEGVFTADSKYSWHLDSNLIKVKILK